MSNVNKTEETIRDESGLMVIVIEWNEHEQIMKRRRKRVEEEELSRHLGRLNHRRHSHQRHYVINNSLGLRAQCLYLTGTEV